MAKLSYVEKVKAAKKNLEVLKSMKPGDRLKVTFDSITKWNREKLQEFSISCWSYSDEDISYSIYKGDSVTEGMNFQPSRTTLKAYTYDMMSQKTTYNFPLYQMNIVEVNKCEEFEAVE